MSVSGELTAVEVAALRVLDERGWTQGSYEDGEGAVCLHGAVRGCDPRQGDQYLVSAVLRWRGFTEMWNDSAGRTEAEVREALGVPVTDAELLGTFGPQWVEVVGLVRRAAALTPDEVRRLAAPWVAPRDAAAAAAWDAAVVTRDAAWAAWDAARDAAAAARDAAVVTRDAAWAAWNAVRDVGGNAALAVSIRDLIGQHGYTQEHHDTLTGPWAEAVLS